jgi:hypothetical protein
VKKQEKCAICLEGPKNKLNKMNCLLNGKQEPRRGLSLNNCKENTIMLDDKNKPDVTM